LREAQTIHVPIAPRATNTPPEMIPANSSDQPPPKISLENSFDPPQQ